MKTNYKPSKLMQRAGRTVLAWRRALALFCFLGAAVLSVAPLSAGGRTARQAVMIPIHGPIDAVLAHTVDRRLREAQADGAEVVIFEMNTPGGEVSAALDICRLIKNLPPGLHTVAWVNPQAYSAGAMISVACREIYMSRASSIGDSAPILMGPGGLQELPPTERAKMESPVLNEFRDSAAANGYSPLLCRAMVTLDTEVWWVENAQTHERRLVDAAEKKALIDELGGDEAGSAWRLVREFRDPLSGQMRTLEQPLDGSASLLTLSQSEAVALGLAQGIAGSPEELADALQLAGPAERKDVSGWETFVIWLNSPLIRGLLLAIAILAGYIEFTHSGLIAPGVVAVLALGVFVGAPYAAGLADIWTIVLLVIGLLLIALEVFVIPGIGITGILGAVAVLVALVGTFIPRTPGAPPFSLPSAEGLWHAIRLGLLIVSSSVIAATIGIVSLSRYIQMLPGARRLVLGNVPGDSVAVTAVYEAGAAVGDIGLLVTPLKPAGQARFGHRVVEVQSQGQYVDPGVRVQVIAVEGPIVYVRPVADSADGVFA